MKDEFTAKMHSELKVSKRDEIMLKAGCVWRLCGSNTEESVVRELSKSYGISYNQAMRYKGYWLARYNK